MTVYNLFHHLLISLQVIYTDKYKTKENYRDLLTIPLKHKEHLLLIA